MSPFVRPRAVSRPRVRLVAFHHAGGSASAFYSLARHVPSDWDVLLLDLPGRGKRHAEPPLCCVAQARARALADLGPWLDAPLALFGHSYGAVLASEVAFALAAEGRAPRWLGVSGRAAPTLPGPPHRLHELSDEALLEELLALGGTPERVRDVPEFRDRFVEVARADLAAVESYVPSFGVERLPCRMAAFSGVDDPWAPPERMRPWSLHAGAGFAHHTFSGAHFYFLGAAFAALAARLVDEVEGALRPTHVPGADRPSNALGLSAPA